MKKKEINLNTTKKKFKVKPLFDDSDIYETKKIDDTTTIEQLDEEIDELVKEIKNNK